MKSTILAIAVAAGLAVAQLDQVPKCALPCVTEYMSGNKIGGCSQLDIKCICSNAEFLNGIACCLKDACTPDEQVQTVSFAKQICSTSGVQVPDEVVCKDSGSTTTDAVGGSASTTGETASQTSVEPSKGSDKPAGAPAALGSVGGLLGAAVLLAI